MKKIFHFTKRRKGSPSASETASVLSVGYDLKEKDLGKVHKAAFTGDVAKLKQLTKKNDLNQLDKENRTALHIACVHGHTEVVQYLVENKVKLNLCDNQNRSALMKAVQCQQDRCVSILLEHEADPNLVDINGNTALHLAARIPSLPVALNLLEHEANINAQNKEGNTPLILSVEENHAEMAEFLLKEGADVNLQNQECRTPLLIAACNGQISMVRLLLQYNADIAVKDNKGWSSDDYAVMNGHHACSHLIIEHGTKRKPLQSPSHLSFNKNKQSSLLGSPEAGFALGGPTLGKDGGSAKEEGKDTEDNSHADSISRASKSGPADSWPSTDDDDDDDDDEQLDLGPKKPQKLNLKKLMSASKIEGKRFTVVQDPDKSWSGTESEPISEGNAIEPMAFPGSSSSTQHPVTPKPISFSNLPQMTSIPLISSQKEIEEKSSSEDEYEEEDMDEECDEIQNERSDVDNLQKTETSKKRDFLSELGIEKEDEEDSPWDSESGSDSPSKKEQSERLNSPTKSHKPMSSIREESSEALHYIPSFLRGSKHSSVFRSVAWPGGQKAVVLRTSQEEEDNSDEEKLEKQHKLLHREPVSMLNKLLESKDTRKRTDVMEELGLGDVDDLEDASDWDSASTTSKASKNLPVYKPEEELASETPLPLPVVQGQEHPRASVAETEGAANTKKEEGKESSLLRTRPLPSPRSFKTLTSTQPQPQPQPQTHIHKESIKKPMSDEESDWDTDNTSSRAKLTTPLPNIVETETGTVSPPEEDRECDHSSEANEHPEEAGVMRGEPKSSVLWKTHGSGKQSDIDQEKGKKADTNPDKPNPKQGGTCDSGSQQKDHVSPKWPTRSPRRKTTLLDDEEKRTMGSQGNLLRVPASKQSSDPCPVNHRNGGPLSVFDDSTLSEVSEDEGRSPSSRHRAEKKNGGELEIADDFEDLTQSSDTATEELDSATSGYFNASLLIKQLDTSSIDSVSMVKLQNMFHEYEHTIQKERNRHSRLADKVSQLEQERNELKLLLDESRESKSSLEHLRLELETDLNNFKFLLKQEQEKHQSASMLYDKTREQLFRKEEQHRDEAEERERAELKMRNLELEIRALMNNMKQLEDDRNETQRLLAHEQSARALQEDLLNSHLRKQQEIEEKNLRNVTKSNEATSQLTEASERERELQQQVCTLQEELSSVRAELEHFRSLSRQEESRLVDERDALRERLEDARRDLKLNDETLAQTVFQYNGQLSTLKSDCTLLSTKLEHERQVRQQLETEAETSKARLQAALQETERCQAARAETERTLQREREQHQRSEEKQTSESNSQRDTIQSLSQKLSEVEARANSLENEWHRATLSVAEKSAMFETAAREREQARARLEELEGTLQSERDRASRAVARQDAMQERLAQAQSEGALLRQQLEEAQNRGTAKEQAVTDAQECFTQALSQLRANGEERVQLVEERSKELATKNAELREQNYRLEQEKADRESSLRQLQQDLADSLKKLSMCEASLEVNTRYRNDLEEEKARTQKDMDRLRGKLQESEENNIQVERRVNTLMGTLDEKERDLICTGQKLQEVLAATTRSEQTIKQLEEAVQRLEIENARLEATAKQQNNRIEILQKEAQEATALTDSSPGGGVRNQLENLVTNLQSSKMTLEDQLSREVQKQSMLSHNAHDSQALWEEELKNRSRFGLRLAELEKEKGELSNQMELERKKAKKIAEQKKAVDARLDQEMKRNTELQKEMYRLRTLVKTAKKKLREQNGGELGSPMGSLRGELSYRQNETEGAVSRMKIKVDELQVQLEREALRCSKLEDMNRELKEQLSSLKSLGRSHERLERSKQQLEEEVTGLRRRMEAGVMDQSQAEQFRRETEERARQEIRHKLDEINLFLQTQAASQEALEQMKAANEASQRAELEQRIRELEADLSRAHTTQQDSLLQRDSSRTELERYRQLYTDELRLRKSLTNKLERSNERLAEANAKLLSERQRSKSLLGSSIINGSLGGPALDTHPPLGRLGLGASLLSPVGEQHTNRVETYLAKMQSELEKNISKELDYGTSELEGASTRMSPVGSACGSQKNLNSNLIVEPQDKLSRATQQYLEVLKKNYMI
ncbi:ankyrin repeat domain-containing protein 26 isoform X8 [Ictalurus punctatus]|uniref:Ankyrin repeat domain-containing protein 26 isoform X8 n=1 Tax=Ictalurus punctatus TaxID=7998 RepID=A0A9F7TQT3_ICTPU|nr:ankyrin repeat domain-containing protein 26 isoform X8 [Ictalurus punctatus]